MNHHAHQKAHESGQKRNVYDVLVERGMIQQVADEAATRDLLSKPPVTLYVGYDPTADSLHVGHMFTLIVLKHFEMHGHRPIAVMGGGTAMIGDPSGKTELRQMLTREQIDLNLQTISQQVARVLDVQGGRSIVVNNADWLCSLSYIEFLRDIGRHFSVNRMLSAEAYKQRLERGLSFIEFNYQLLQAYDFLELSRRYDCKLQMGGDDQWGNILAGHELCRRVDQREVQCITLPLLLTAAGQKMGKTASGAVWLDPERTSAYEFYQYWVNTHDADVARFLSFFTFLPMSEIERVRQLAGGPELNTAKAVLAFEVTCLVHGDSAAREAHAAAMGAFGNRVIADDLLPSSAVPRRSEAAIEQVPTTSLSTHDLSSGITVVDLLVLGGLADSKKQARRLIEQGAVKLNQDEVAVADILHIVKATDFQDGALVIRAGKKKVHRFSL